SARYVGFALHGNPEPGTTPCHRVVFKDGSICKGFAFGGPEVQKQLLLDEGVTFLEDGRVDMARCRWL
ncbi:MAG: MGMT family protein, partial [Ruthenibacterium sp.]